MPSDTHIDYLFAPPQPASLPIVGQSRRFPVRRIFCVGRNYLEHIRELGNDEKLPPVFFMKPAQAIVQDGSTMAYGTLTENFHYELELALALQSGGYNIDENQALQHIYGYAIALDMTKRDVQDRLKKNGHPWEAGKSFDASCPCGPIHPAETVGHLDNGRICLKVNGEIRQDSNLDMLIWKIPQIVAELSRYFELQAGDIILTGTPKGVGPVVPGDVMEGSIDGLGSLNIKVGPRIA